MKASGRHRWRRTGAEMAVFAVLFCTVHSPAQSASTNVVVAVEPGITDRIPTNALPTVVSTNRVSPVLSTNSVTRTSLLPRSPAAGSPQEGAQGGGVFVQGTPGSVEARMERYERMNGHSLFDFDKGSTRRLLKSPGVSPQYRWDAFQNGKAPPRAFRDGITSSYWD